MRKARERHARAKLIRENYDTVLARFMLYAARLRQRPSNRASLLDTVILRR
jgi:hypothetical protein